MNLDPYDDTNTTPERLTASTLAERAAPDAEYAHTGDAGALVDALDQAGLNLSAEATHKLLSSDQGVFDGGFAWLNRAVAGWINDPAQRGRLFTAEAGPLDVSRLSPTGSVGADFIIDVVRQAAVAEASGERTSTIPASNMTDRRQSSCRDVEIKFAQAASLQKIDTVSRGNSKFWRKNHGDPTLINLQPVSYKGIALPPGCLFRDEPDGLQLLRVTGLAFNQMTAEQLFGSGIQQLNGAIGGSEQLAHLFSLFRAATTES